MLTHREILSLEEKTLAPYAVKAKDTRGREHKEKEHPYRSCFQRDRDRIIHSTAFRRLEYKTQVFVNHEGDYYRTRLTHTLEVAQLARSIAHALRLNQDLVESIALAHDLGHTPFGHSGEDALAEIMKDHGGFDHNLQGLRVVDKLEKRYIEFDGLNLSWEIREGIVKHSTDFDRAHAIKEFRPDLSAPLEAQVVDVADEIAYDNHDLDDGITSGILALEDLEKVQLWKEVSRKISMVYANIDRQIHVYQVIKNLINLQVTDLISESEKRVCAAGIAAAEDARNAKERLIVFSGGLSEERKALREFLKANLYNHYKVVRMSDKAHRFIRDLFGVYLARPQQLPATSFGRIKTEGAHRAICDYIAGMTDRYAQDEYKKLFQPYERV